MSAVASLRQMAQDAEARETNARLLAEKHAARSRHGRACTTLASVLYGLEVSAAEVAEATRVGRDALDEASLRDVLHLRARLLKLASTLDASVAPDRLPIAAE